MQIVDIVHYNNLYDFYKNLLTEKQRQYYEDYYFSNMSLHEMAEEYKVSRNAIYKQLQNILKKLDYFEQELGMYKKSKELLNILEEIENPKLKQKLTKLFIDD